MNNDNSKLILSICIPVFNQIDIVKECVSHILECESKRFEVVISDDGSTEPIKEMLNEFKDNRIKYYKNENNLGHDRNIIASFKHATASYALLLRSRDYTVKDGLETLIDYLRYSGGIAYLAANAYDSNFLPKIVYNDHIYKKGENALSMHNKLYVHPSGSVYNISMVDLDEVDTFLNNVEATKYNFTVHSLVRMILSLKGDFVTLNEYVWVYSDTADAEDVAVNSSKKQKSVYDTEYQIERYKTEMLWADKVLDEKYKTEQFLHIFSFYLYATTWNNKLLYENKMMRHHYNYEYKKIDCRREREYFICYSNDLEKKLNINNSQYYKKKKKLVLNNIVRERFKYYIAILKMKIPAKKQIKRLIYGVLNLRKVE